MIVIDTNVLVYHLAGNHEQFSPASTAFMRSITSGAETGYVSAVCIAECLHVFRSAFEVPEMETAGLLLELCSSPMIVSEVKDALLLALEHRHQQKQLDFADCYHLALASTLGAARVASFDKRMRGYDGVERIEPS